MLKIRRSRDRLILNMGIPIPGNSIDRAQSVGDENYVYGDSDWWSNMFRFQFSSLCSMTIFFYLDYQTNQQFDDFEQSHYEKKSLDISI